MELSRGAIDAIARGTAPSGEPVIVQVAGELPADRRRRRLPAAALRLPPSADSPSAPLPPLPAGLKRLQSAQAQQDRYRMLLSDGEYSKPCMLATQLAELVSSNQLKEGSIIRLTDYISNAVQDKK